MPCAASFLDETHSSFVNHQKALALGLYREPFRVVVFKFRPLTDKAYKKSDPSLNFVNL